MKPNTKNKSKDKPRPQGVARAVEDLERLDTFVRDTVNQYNRYDTSRTLRFVLDYLRPALSAALEDLNDMDAYLDRRLAGDLPIEYADVRFTVGLTRKALTGNTRKEATE